MFEKVNVFVRQEVRRRLDASPDDRHRNEIFRLIGCLVMMESGSAPLPSTHETISTYFKEGHAHHQILREWFAKAADIQILVSTFGPDTLCVLVKWYSHGSVRPFGELRVDFATENSIRVSHIDHVNAL